MTETTQTPAQPQPRDAKAMADAIRDAADLARQAAPRR